jgi:urease accessory protein
VRPTALTRRRRDHRRTATQASHLTSPSLLQLIWLASPALPVGGFSYSEVLEAAGDAGLATSETEACHWLLDQLHLGLSRGDLALVARAHSAWRRCDAAEAAALNTWVVTTRESHELRQQTEQMGRSLVEWMKHRPLDARHVDQLQILASLRPAPTWPVAFALAALQAGAPCRDTLLCFAFGWAENMVQAALKSVPLGQAAGQRILSALAAEIPDAVDAAIQLGNAERQVCTPMLAILSAQHETQYSRLFRS